MIGLIVARSRNNVIGNEDGIPWKIKGEQSQFKELTTGNAIIMGRKTYEDIRHPLPNRLNIVVSGTMSFDYAALKTARSLNEAINIAHECGFKKIFIIGGRRLYEEAIPIVDEMYITEIDMDVEVTPDTVFFPEFNKDNFMEKALVNDEHYTVTKSVDLVTGKQVLYERDLYTKIKRIENPEINHKYILVNTDEMKKEKFDGDLADFAGMKLSMWKCEEMPDARVISIEKSVWTDEIKPRMDNSSTWYKRTSMQLSVWLENKKGE